MDPYILSIITLCCMAIVDSHAATTPETYWKNVLPNIPMPLAVRNSLPHLEWMENRATVSPVQGDNFIKYAQAATEAQLLDESTRSIYFFEKDIKVGSHMTIKFTKSLNNATFITREEANAIPYSSDKLPEIIREFSFKPDSAEAQVVKTTLKDCETKGIQGEQKYCVTSLESMVDYATSTLGTNIKAISTIGYKYNKNKLEKYTITRVIKTSRENKSTICHKLNYPYAVFYCHKTNTATSSYVVTLVDSNGSSTKAVAICHKDTNGWNPKHLAFQVLNVKPGTVPVCHFLPEENVIWVPNN